MNNVLALANASINLDKQALAELNDIFEDYELPRIEFPTIWIISFNTYSHSFRCQKAMLLFFIEGCARLITNSELNADPTTILFRFDFSDEEIDAFLCGRRILTNIIKDWELDRLRQFAEEIIFSYQLNVFISKLDLKEIR